MTYPQGGPGDPYGQQPGGYDPYGQQPYSAQPYSGQPGYDPYGQQGYQQGYQQPYQNPYQPRGTNTMAILSLVFAFVFAPLAIVFGHMAKKQIKERGEEGDGLATAGLVIGYIFTGLALVGCCLDILLFGALGLGSSTTSSSTYDNGYTFILQSLAATLGR